MSPPRLPLALLFAGCVLSGRAAIVDVACTTVHPTRFAKMEWVVLVDAPFSDPRRSAEIALDLEVTAPSGEVRLVPGFWEFSRPPHPSVWKVRFSPRETGEHHARLRLSVADTTDRRGLPSFTVAPSAGRGFLRPGDAWTLRFDNGTAFRGLGLNFGWESRSEDDSRFFRERHENTRYHYDFILGRLADRGANFIRTWMSVWNLPLEWKTVIHTDRYSTHSSTYNPDAIRRLDDLIELLDQTDTYVMLTLDHAGCYIGGQWELNPYNVRQGGPAADPGAFFTDPTARAWYRDRLRFLVARWGYSPRIAMWELFNEIDNVIHGQATPIPAADVVAWHAEMAAWLKQIDPARRIVTTSVSHREVEGLAAVSDLDLHQRHVYGSTAGFAALLQARSTAASPYVIGEYAWEWDWSKDFDLFGDAMDREFRRGLWRGLFAPTPVLPLSWWWEYFEHRGQLDRLPAVAALLQRMLDAGDGRFQAADVAWTPDPAAPGGECLAVQCGDELYVWLAAPPDAAAAGRVRLTPPRPAEHFILTRLDPATGTAQRESVAGRDLPAEWELRLPPGTEQVLILSVPQP